MTVPELIDQILRRLDELEVDHPVHWTREEILTFINDGLSELNIIAWLVQSTIPDTISPAGNVYVHDPEDHILGPIAIRINNKYLLREGSEDLDREVGWEAADQTRMEIKVWSPVGLNRYVIWPRPLAEQTAYIEALVEHTPVEDDDASILPVPDVYRSILEDFCIERAEFKEGGAELQQASAQYMGFIDGAQQISGRNIIRGYPRYMYGTLDDDDMRGALEVKR